MDKKTRKVIIRSQAGFAVMYVLLKYVWIGFENIFITDFLNDLVSMTLIATFIILWSIVIYNSYLGVKTKNELEQKKEQKKQEVQQKA